MTATEKLDRICFGLFTSSYLSLISVFFRFPHEVRSGKTSSVCVDVIGFDYKGKVRVFLKLRIDSLV